MNENEGSRSNSVLVPSDKLKAMQAHIAELEARDSDAAKYVETTICMRTHFTGNHPYVGWKGLGLALTETLDMNAARIAELERKLAEQQALNKALPARIADICFSAGTTDHLCVARFWLDSLHEEKLQPLDMATEELNNLLAKAKEEGRKEKIDIAINYAKAQQICNEYNLNYNKFCSALRTMLAAAPKPQGETK